MLQALVYSIKNTLISFTPEFTKAKFLQPCVLYWCVRSGKLQPKLFLQSSIRACLCVPSFPILSLPFPWKREENWLGLVWLCLFACLFVCWCVLFLEEKQFPFLPAGHLIASDELPWWGAGEAPKPAQRWGWLSTARLEAVRQDQDWSLLLEKNAILLSHNITSHLMSFLSLFAKGVGATILLMYICQIWLTGSK